MDRDRIGFIGVGLMGQGMAANILKRGFPLAVVGHRNRAPVEALVADGAVETVPERIGEVADVILLCLPGAPQVRATVAAMLPALQSGAVVIDCSTSDPAVSEEIAASLAERGVHFADAPLGRTPAEAWAGTLDVMVGADEAVLARIRPVLDCFAGRILHMGGVGNGHRMKLLNNFLSLGYAALYSEALTLAGKVGIPVAAFDGVISGGRMDCGFWQTFRRYAVEGDRDAHKFTLTNALKDIRYVEGMANAAGVATVMAGGVKTSLSVAVANGGDGPQDYLPHLPDWIARMNGVR